MGHDPTTIAPTLAYPDAPHARAALQALIARLSDAEAVALWQLIVSWYSPARQEREEIYNGP